MMVTLRLRLVPTKITVKGGAGRKALLRVKGDLQAWRFNWL